MTAGHTPDEVTFSSSELTLVGHLRRPSGTSPPYPAVLLTGPFTSVEEQVTGTHAAALSDRGHATLAFDHRNFGASDGDPRQHEDSAGKLADLRDATSFLATHPDIDERRIGCVGVCLGASYALRHTAFDPRVAAVALVAGGYNDPAVMRAEMGTGAYHETMATFAAVAQRSPPLSGQREHCHGIRQRPHAPVPRRRARCARPREAAPVRRASTAGARALRRSHRRDIVAITDGGRGRLAASSSSSDGGSADDFRAFWSSPDHAPLRDLRHAASQSRIVTLAGLPDARGVCTFGDTGLTGRTTR